ncbi:MAG TPA: NAD-dependent epimerase/dehydratase family protein [Trueperaceae bacterium]|nr:NAD-dependent epimerase/dehydratase family protein [Trueperaceae bacterium]
MKVLVTGAHGFLGSHITEALLTAGHQVRALVSPWGDTGNLAGVALHGGLEVQRADLSREGAVSGLCVGVEVVVHAAARVADWGPWEAFYRTNVVGTRQLLREAATSGARRFVLISSVAVHRYSGFRNADPRTRPRDNVRDAYAHSKIMAEDLVFETPDLEAVVVRPGLWPFGPRDPNIRRVARALEQGLLPMVGSGESVINTAYAENLALGVRLSVERPEASGRVYLIADEGMPTWREVLTELARLLGERPPRLRLPRTPTKALASGLEATWGALFPRNEPPMTRYRAGLMARDVHFNIRHAVEELGYRPAVSWQEGLRRTVGALAPI